MPKKRTDKDKASVDLDGKEMKKLMKEKAKRRQILREYFQKQVSDPFKHISGEGGTVFDPAILRYHAMKTNYYEFFKPTFSNALIGIIFMVLPMVTLGYFMYNDRTDLESRIRRGEVAYKDRRSKFI